jgi:MoaA/NifB/PqqE/SkfB family radical SAM enzyme
LTSPADLATAKALDIITQISEFANPILVLSGGEPLYRTDIFQLANFATERGLRVALATNGTLVTKEIARKIVDAGVKRVSISLDGVNAETHDTFRGIPGAFDAAIYGFRNLKEIGMPVQINMTIARHNAKQLPAVLDLVRNLGADALHTFLLVPVGCGVDIAEAQMVPPEEYEDILNWFYDQEQIGDIELKATCAPHYFRVVRQRRAAERRAEGYGVTPATPAIGATEMTMPGSTGIDLKATPTITPASRASLGTPTITQASRAGGHPGGHPVGGKHPDGLNAVTKGCLAGTGVCFISHQGEVFPCGYLPVLAGDLRKQSFAEIWTKSQVF